MKRDTAEHILATTQGIMKMLDSSMNVFLQNQESTEDYNTYRKTVAWLMGHIYADIERPIFSQYPDLTPEELRPNAQNPPK